MIQLRTIRSLVAPIAALALMASAVSAPAQTVDGKPEVKQAVLDAMTSTISKRAFVPGVDFGKWKEFLDQNKEKLDATANDEDFAAVINGALRKFGLSHILLHTPRAADARRTNSAVGIGISPQPVDEGIMVMRVIPGAPAQKAGLKPGDIILEVDGKKIDGTRGIAGAEGTEVKLKVKLSNAEVKDFTLTRARFSTRFPEELTVVNSDTVRLEIRTFDLSYDRKNVEKLVTEASSKSKNLILDLRGNPGGAVINLQHLLGCFIDPEETVGTFVNRRMLTSYKEETGKEGLNLAEVANWATEDNFAQEKVHPFKLDIPRYTGKVVVLVDSGSGSAAEMAAAALQDVLKAPVVGRKSAGAVLASFIVPIANGFQLQYPIQDYVTVKGVRLEGTGVIPDAAADGPRFTLPGQQDPIIEKALALVVKTGR
ncbi:MAG: S41 family peptidase [Fimbriimonas sp.]